MIQHNNYRILTTDELLNYVKICSLAHAEGKRDNAVVEAEIRHGAIKFSYFLEWWNGRLHVEGIDSERYRTSLKQFRKQYPKTNWTLDDWQ